MLVEQLHWTARTGWTTRGGTTGGRAELILMVSCMGRFVTMGQRIIEELAFASGELGDEIPCVGFYSFGEIAPLADGGPAVLHNQTITAIMLAETED